AVTGPLLVTVNDSGISASLADGSEFREIRTPVHTVVLGMGNDRVRIDAFPEGGLTVRDPGGDDVYDVTLGRAASPKAPGLVNIVDRAGTFDEIVLHQPNYRSPLEIGPGRTVNGRESLTYDAGIERQTVEGKGARFDNQDGITDFGEPVAVTGLAGSNTSNLGQ